MKLHQIRFVHEVAERGFNVSRAAVALHTSQPSVSRQILELESELGVPIFERGRNRITGLTPAGVRILDVVRNVLRECGNLQKIGQEFADHGSGSLTITTSHTLARYALPHVMQQFIKQYPNVRLRIRQGNPGQILNWVSSGEAEVSISSDPMRERPDLVLLPAARHTKLVLVPVRHPLLGRKALTLRELAKHPLITYDAEFSTHWQVLNAFEGAQLTPHIVLSATDVDVMKTYVKCGMGVAIVASLAYVPKEDRELRAIDARHLFETNQISVGLRKNSYLPGYAFDFIKLFAPKLTRPVVERALTEGNRRDPAQ